MTVPLRRWPRSQCPPRPLLLFSRPTSLSRPRWQTKTATAQRRRHASTNTASSVASSVASSAGASLRFALYSGAVATTLGLGYLYATDTRASIHQWLVPRLARLVFPDAEDAHRAGIAALRFLYALGLHPRERAGYDSSAPTKKLDLPVDVFGMTLRNPLAISAGFDKHAEVPDALFALGPAVVEVGGCTPLPQEGNPRPRAFRIPALDGLINRYGLNSCGADAMAARLRARARRFARERGLTEAEVLDGAAGVPPGSLAEGKMLLVQIAKNKGTEETDRHAVAADHTYCAWRLAPYADVLVVNVSSPNTPGLRDLQAVGPLTDLLKEVVYEAKTTKRRHPPRVMVKVSPDEDSDSQMLGVVQAVYRSGADGVIVGNTTKRRTGLVPEGVVLTAKEKKVLMTESGGYSGPALFDRTVKLVAKYRNLLDVESLRPSGGAHDDDDGDAVASRAGRARKVIFATGGISNGQQAVEALDAGASVAMVYTTMVYNGVGTITRMKKEMKERVEQKRAE